MLNDTSLSYDTNFCLEAKWLIPLNKSANPNNRALKDTAIIIENQIITDILPIAASRNKYPELARKILNHHVIMPGLINAHTHSPMNLLKGYADDLPLMTWLNDHIWPIEHHFFSSEFAYEGAILAICEMLKGGVTCFNDMYFYSNDIARAAAELGIRACIGTHVFDPPSPWADNTDDYLARCQEVISEYKNNSLITPIVCPHAPYTVSDESFKKVMSFSEKNNLSIGCHIHETNDEIQQSLEQYKMRPIERLHKLGLLDHNLHAIHMTQLNVDEIELVAKKNVSVVHCPESNLKLASGFCPVKELLEYNINLAIGTDGAASNNDLDMLSEIRTAALVAKTTAMDPTTLPDYQALECATINGAKAVNLQDRIGSLEIGKQADLIAIDLSDYGSQPVYNPLSSIVYTATRQQVSDVWVNGMQKVADKKLIAFDNSKIQKIIDKWSDKITNFKK